MGGKNCCWNRQVDIFWMELTNMLGAEFIGVWISSLLRWKSLKISENSKKNIEKKNSIDGKSGKYLITTNKLAKKKTKKWLINRKIRSVL